MTTSAANVTRCNCAAQRALDRVFAVIRDQWRLDGLNLVIPYGELVAAIYIDDPAEVGDSS